MFVPRSNTKPITTCIFGSNSNISITKENNNHDIMYAIITRNLQNTKKLINESNINNIIDNVNGYTALHHAVRIKENDSIIKYLLSIGANPKIKNTDKKDSIDLSIEANYRLLIDELFKDKEHELDNFLNKYDLIIYNFKDLEKKNKDLVDENNYLKKSSDQYVERIETLKSENTTLKRKYEDSEKAFSNLLKKTKK